VKLNYRTFLAAVGVALSMTVLLGAPPVLRAQQAAGSITGVVADPSGAPIINATVTVREVDRGTVWTAKTTAAGVYDFPTVPVGNVEVKAEASGFAVEVRKAFALAVDQVAQVNFKLQVGAVTETVTVNEAPPLLQTASTEVGTLIDGNAASQLPLATRDINQLTLLAPGVLSSNIFAFQSAQTTFGTGRPYVNGAREQDNNFILDGMDINQPDNDEVSYTPAPDAVQEFNIITSNAPADYGNYAGGVIVESMKSGTNSFHGVAYEYVRNTDLEANTWQDKAVASIVGFGTQTVIPRPALHWNEFGGQVGGPIVKNKLFFFADEETSLYDQPRTGNQNTLVPNSNYYTPTAGTLGGQVYDLGYACTGNGGTFNAAGVCQGKGSQLYMPAAGTAPSSRQPIPYNQIPVSAVDPVAKALVSLPAFQNQVSNLNYYSSGYTHNFQGDLKIDWQASEKDHVMGRYTQMYTHLISANGTDVLTPNLERQYPLKNIIGDYVRTISPTLVNDFRVGATIFPANDGIYTSAVSGNVNSQIGLQGVPVDLLPSISMGYGSVGGSDLVEVFHDTTGQIDDSLTWTRGRHSIHTGFEFLHWVMNDTYPGNNGVAGSWSFSGQFTDSSGAAGGPDNSYADFLLGLPGNVAVGQPLHFHLVNSLGAGFVQDDFLAGHGLTLNLGLRYEVVTPRGDRTTNNNVNFDKVTGTPEIGENYNTYWGIGDLNPRFGFAWQPGWAPNTVIRGAYDISSFMEGNGISNMAVINPPNELQINQIYNSGTDYPTNTFSQGYSPYQTVPCTAQELIAAGTTGTASPCLSGEVTHATDPNLRPAMNQQWNFTIQHQFHNNFTASAAYVGNHDTHMADIYWYNQKVLTSGTQQVKDLAGNLVTVPAVAAGPYMQNLVKAGVSQARFNASDAISNYDALELTLAQKGYHGLDLQANYTYSKCLTNSLGYFGVYGDEEGTGEQQNEAGGNFFQNEYNPMGDYGKCTIDALHAFNAYGLYNLPFGQGQQFGSGVSKGVNEIIGGWNISLDTTLRSGFAVTAIDGEWMGSFNPAGASNLTAPSYMPRPNCNNSVNPNTSYQFAQIGSSVGMVNLNPAYITSPQSDGDFGTCGVGTMRGPYLKTADMNLNKTFPITEGTSLTFIAQFMNLTNTPIFSIPATWDDNYSSCEYCTGQRLTGPAAPNTPGMGPYGLMDGSNPGRQIELALKLNF
jgi:Carboxypeptidase regulatory-like domain/TonB-dependent Receptor Plug Domain